MSVVVTSVLAAGCQKNGTVVSSRARETAGVCTPRLVVPTQDSLWDVGVIQGNLYWNARLQGNPDWQASRSVFRAPLGTTDAQMIASGMFACCLHDDTDFYWMHQDGQGFYGDGTQWYVQRMPLGGGPAVRLFDVSSDGQPEHNADYVQAVDDTSIYWTEWGHGDVGGMVFRMPKAGGQPQVLLDNIGGASTMIVDGEQYFVGAWFTYGIWTGPKTGGPARVLVGENNAPTRLAQDDSFIYYGSEGFGVTRLQKDCGQPLRIGNNESWNGETLAITVDDTSVYWLQVKQKEQVGQIWRARKDDSEVAKLYEAPIFGYSMALDNGTIYFPVGGQGIMTLDANCNAAWDAGTPAPVTCPPDMAVPRDLTAPSDMTALSDMTAPSDTAGNAIADLAAGQSVDLHRDLAGAPDLSSTANDAPLPSDPIASGCGCRAGARGAGPGGGAVTALVMLVIAALVRRARKRAPA